jgi:hypothetical protein
MYGLKFILLNIFYFINNSFAVNCYVNNDVITSNILFSYKGKVYDSTGYKHPGGKNDINRLIGNDLETFVNENKYSFHLKSSEFTSDLLKMYVGDLKDSCIDPTVIPPSIPAVPSTPIVPSITAAPSTQTVSSTSIVPSITVDPTSSQITKIFTTIPCPKTTDNSIPYSPPPPVVNNSNKNFNYNILLFLTTFIAVFTI